MQMRGLNIQLMIKNKINFSKGFFGRRHFQNRVLKALFKKNFLNEREKVNQEITGASLCCQRFFWFLKKKLKIFTEKNSNLVLKLFVIKKENERKKERKKGEKKALCKNSIFNSKKLHSVHLPGYFLN